MRAYFCTLLGHDDVWERSVFRATWERHCRHCGDPPGSPAMDDRRWAITDRDLRREPALWDVIQTD